jgi:hypothetical protein
MKHANSIVWRFIRLVLSNWSSRVTGPLSAILIITGIGLNVARSFGIIVPITLESLTWLFAIVCVVQAVYSVWYKEYIAHRELLSRIRPKLKCDFDSTLTGCIQKGVRITRGSSSSTTTSTTSQLSLFWSGDLRTVQPTGPSLFVSAHPISTPATYYRIKVDADGSSSVTGCCGYLRDIKRWEGNKFTSVLNGNNLRLTFAPPEQRDTIAKKIDSGISQYLDFFVVTDNNEPLIPTYKWEIPSALSISEIFSHLGYYIFVIAIVPGEGNPVQIEIKILWRGNHRTVDLSRHSRADRIGEG